MNESSSQSAVTRTSAYEHHSRTRTAIVDTAALMLYHRGVAATTIDDVSDASGTNVPELKRHFDGKVELIEAVIARELAVVLDGHDAADAIGSWDGLDAWVDRVMEAQPTQDGAFACPLGTLATELKNSQEYRPALDAAFRSWEGHLAAGLRRIQECGELDPDADPDRLAASLLAALQGGYLLASVHGRIGIMRDVLEDAVAAMRRYRV